MRFYKIFLSTLFVLFSCTQIANAQSKNTVYIFGLSDSMRDSIVYNTTVQRIDNANLQKRTKFLLDRSDYAQQLKEYFAQRLNDKSRINVIYVARSEKAAYKKLYKVRRNYLSEGAIVQQIDNTDFAFTPIEGVSDNSEDVKRALSTPQ